MSSESDPNHESDQPGPENDPVERALRIGRLRAELAELTGEPVAEHTADSPQEDDPEAMLKHMEALENGPLYPLADILKEQRNFTPAPPARLENPVDIHENLWLLLHALASMRVFVEDTNHLSDAELYEVLVERMLRSEIASVPVSSGWNCRFSICELCDERRTMPECWLRYYADDTQRAELADQFPGEAIPPKEPQPYDRDDFLPTFP